jgi:hypothetical protein
VAATRQARSQEFLLGATTFRLGVMHTQKTSTTSTITTYWLALG